MFKKLDLILFCVSASLAGSLSAAQVNAPTGYTITIPAGETFEFSNPFFELSGVCTVSLGPDQSIDMTGTVIRPTITLDGVEYKTAGGSTHRTIHNGDSFSLKASYYSAVRLKNEGKYDMKADCTLMFSPFRAEKI